ncbi:MAG: nicotinate-nucleotide diphosphorylase (carboxylating) [Flavobacteriales bacterium]|nr:nicotinate-nucleotide diphosphorylase (carboxylating) [Flavobacteriales bacterium]|tara:strand:+ start:3354 stop:4193 length:840 start_codon:yes stop_codon:yes gene_type:complete
MDKIINDFIKKSLEEDIGHGDITSQACISKNAIGSAKMIAKDNCIIAGINIAKKIFNYFDKELQFHHFTEDGKEVNIKDVIFEITGKQQAILATERLVLNCMQRMSGIATKTRSFINQVQDLNTVLLDTRKTCPSIRFLDKEAVRIGGAQNHRHGLYDVIMIKDNHIDFSGGISNAIKNCHKHLKKIKKDIKIIIEVRDLDELNQVLISGGVDRILLDNFSLQRTKLAVDIINGKYEIESSGNINLQTVRGYALCGVNYISIGNLTHSIKSIDLSMRSI